MDRQLILSLVLAIIAAVVGYTLFRILSTKKAEEASHRQHVLGEISRQANQDDQKNDASNDQLNIIKNGYPDSSTLNILSGLPIIGRPAVIKMARADKVDSAGFFVSSILVFIAFCLFAVQVFNLPSYGFILAIVLPVFLANYILNSRIAKRKRQFMDMFPDALDMIVRGIRSGFPVNTAITLLADNIDEPAKTEFRQVADELALGRPLTEALSQLSVRVDEQDVKFFIVVLKIQQETGGNLAEVLTNLSKVVRGRKQLRLKVRALTAEGRVTSYILGGIPLIIFAAISFMNPEHTEPLFTTSLGNSILVAVAGLIGASQVIVRKMCDFKT